MQTSKRSILLKISVCLFVIFLISCDEDIEIDNAVKIVKYHEAIEVEDSNMVVDFSFRKSGSCYIEMFAECKSLPEGSKLIWYIDNSRKFGADITNEYYSDSIPVGKYTITLYATTPSGTISYKTKEFEVFEDSIISEGLPIDTNSYNPMIDFTFDVRYSEDSTMAFIDMEDISYYDNNSVIKRQWYVNGDSYVYQDGKNASSGRLRRNRHYGILFGVTIDDEYYSLVKELYITDIKE